MDNSVKRYRERRAERLAEKKPARMDAVDEYRERRKNRLKVRLDAGQGWVFGALKSKGVDTKGMDLGEAFEKWNEINKGESKGKKEGSDKSLSKTSKGTKPSIKGVTYEKSESGFEVPVFDEATFTDNFEEKKKIAREAAKSLIPAIKKELSTKVRDINRPEVNDGTREYLKKTVSSATPEQIEKGLEEAAKIYEYWEKNEPEITNAVVGAVKGIGGSMYGLDNRLKFDKSLAKKAIADAIDPDQDFDGDISRAAAGIKDGCRYTAVFDTENFTEGYKKVKEALEKMGIREYRCKNFFSQYRDQDGGNGKIGEQKSVQCVFETPDGQKFEFQFHTPESMAAKEVNHPTYKQKKEPASEYKEYNRPRSEFMRDTSSVVPDPKGVFDIEGHERGKFGYK